MNRDYVPEQRTVSPERPDLVLTTDIPDGERNVLVFDSLNVETCADVNMALLSGYIRVALTDGGDGGDNFTELELVQDGSLTSGI
jgi:hypothetical protein